MMKVRMIEQRDNGVCLFELKNDEIKVITDRVTVMRDGGYVGTLVTAESDHK